MLNVKLICLEFSKRCAKRGDMSVQLPIFVIVCAFFHILFLTLQPLCEF